MDSAVGFDIVVNLDVVFVGFYNFGHTSKTVVSNGSIFSISKVSCSDNILIE